MGAVTPGDVGGLARLRRAIWPRDPGTYTTRGLFESHHLALSFDVDAGLVEAVDQHAFVFVLRKDQHVRERTDARSDIAECRAGHLSARRPEIDRGHRTSTGDDGVGKADLAVPLESPGVHGQRAGRRARLRRLVDDAHANAQPCEPQGQHQPCGPGANDEDFGIAHRRYSILSCGRLRMEG